MTPRKKKIVKPLTKINIQGPITNFNNLIEKFFEFISYHETRKSNVSMRNSVKMVYLTSRE